MGRRARRRRKTREPGRGHDDTDRPASIAWVSRQGAVVIQATQDCTVPTVPQAANVAVHAGRRLSTDAASSSQAVQGDVPEFVHHTRQESARGDVHENRAACLCSWRKPSLRGLRGVRKFHRPGYVGVWQCLRHLRQHKAFAQAELSLQAA